MSKYIAKYRENDSPNGREIYLSIEGVELGFIATPSNGEDLDMFPAMSQEEAKEDMEHYFSDYDTFEYLD